MSLTERVDAISIALYTHGTWNEKFDGTWASHEHRRSVSSRAVKSLMITSISRFSAGRDEKKREKKEEETRSFEDASMSTLLSVLSSCRPVLGLYKTPAEKGALNSRSPTKNEAVGCDAVQVDCQMARTETVNEETKRNERNTLCSSHRANTNRWFPVPWFPPFLLPSFNWILNVRCDN